MRTGLAGAVQRCVPAWENDLTPHTLRHFCASSLYEEALGLKAIQELLWHSWLFTTSRYVHVDAEHIEQACDQANHRSRPA